MVLVLLTTNQKFVVGVVVVVVVVLGVQIHFNDWLWNIWSRPSPQADQ